MSEKLIMPSIGMLPVEDLIKELQNHDNLVSTDNIAKALGLTKEQISNILISSNNSRSIADDSLKLGGLNAEEYITQNQKEGILDEARNIMSSNPNEIQLLRDELYAMKGELIRKGFMDDTMVANGFIDGFQSNNILYDENSATVISKDGNSTITQSSKVAVKGEYAVICSGSDYSNLTLSKIIAETPTSSTFDTLPSDVAIGSKVKKTVGSYNKGAFSFSKLQEAVLGKEKYIVLNDDSNVTEFKINPEQPGIASIIRIPAKCTGVLKSITINAKPVSSPGALKCYVIRDKEPSYSDTNITGDILNLAESNGHIIGESRPMSIGDISDENELTFVIKDEDDAYPEVSNVNYLFIIKDTAPSSDSYWKVDLGRKETGGDLQTNNHTFIYNETLQPIADDADMLYSIITQKVEYGEEKPYRVGLYSTNDIIKTPTYMQPSRARLTLEVNKEGNLKVSNSTSYTSTIQVNNENNVLQAGNIVVVGTTIAQVTAAQPSSITLNKSVVAESGASIYKVAYKPQIETYLETVDDANQSTISNDKFSTLELVGIIPSRRTNQNGNGDNHISDRLIFESSESFEPFNRCKLQIGWDSSASELSDEFVGRIYNLSLVFDNK